MGIDGTAVRRRRYLTILTASAAGAAGCLGDDQSGADPGGTDDPSDGTDEPPTTTHEPTDPGTPTSSDEDYEFPPDDDGVDEVVWYEDVDDPSDRVVLEPDLETTALPDAAGTFALHNRTDRTFATNYYDWRLYRHEGGRWHRVAPLFVNQPLMYLEAGKRHAWSFTGSSEIPDERVPRAGGTESADVQPIGGGTYAFAASGWFPDQAATPTHEHETVFAAQFELDGPTLELAPSGAVTAVERDGSVVSVEAEGRTSEDGRLATYVLSRTSEAAAPHTLITEAAYREWPLRDALAHVEEGVDEVRLRAPTGAHPPFGVHNDDPPSFTYEGTAWQATVENVEGED